MYDKEIPMSTFLTSFFEWFLPFAAEVKHFQEKFLIDCT